MKISLQKQEAVLLFLYCGDSRRETIENLREMQKHLTSDEQDLMDMANSLAAKLDGFDDREFEAALSLADDMV